MCKGNGRSAHGQDIVVCRMNIRKVISLAGYTYTQLPVYIQYIHLLGYSGV